MDNSNFDKNYSQPKETFYFEMRSSEINELPTLR